MKKLILILPLFLLILSIILTGCKQKVDTKNIYVTEYNNLMKAVDDLSSHINITEVSKEYPGVLSDSYYKNYDGIYFETSKKDIGMNNESISNISNLMNKYFVRIIIDRAENIIIFQTISEFRYGEYLIYSKNKIQQSDKTLTLSSWLDDNWYIATSN